MRHFSLKFKCEKDDRGVKSVGVIYFSNNIVT